MADENPWGRELIRSPNVVDELGQKLPAYSEWRVVGGLRARDKGTYLELDAQSPGLDFKASVRAATAAALAANTRIGNVLTANSNGALAAIDGVVLVVGNALLVKNEATGANNGIYTVTSVGSAGTPWVLTRRDDADETAEIAPGFMLTVEEGSTNDNTLWMLTTNAPITLNATSLAFTKLAPGAGSGSLSAPANPADDGKIPRALAGDFVYVGGAAANNLLRWDGSLWAPSSDIGGLTRVSTAALAAEDNGSIIANREAAPTNLMSSGLISELHFASAAAPRMVFKKSRGTKATPLVVNNTDNIGAIYFAAHDGNSFEVTAGIEATINGTVADEQLPTDLIFYTTATHEGAIAERLRIASSGLVKVAGSLAIGATVAAAGSIRGETTFTIKALDGGTDRALLSWSGNAVELGDATNAATNIQSGGQTSIFGTGVRLVASSPMLQLGLNTGSGAGSAAGSGHVRGTKDFTFNIRNGADSGDLVLIAHSGTTLTYGNTTDTTIFDANASGHMFKTGGTSQFEVLSGTLAIRVNNFQWGTPQAPDLNVFTAGSGTGTQFTIRSQDISGTGTVVGGKLFYRGGDCTATGAVTSQTGGNVEIKGGAALGSSGTRNGGNVQLRGGVGPTAPGYVQLIDSASSELLRAGGTAQLGFFGNGGVTIRTDPGALTDSTGGTANGTLVDVGAAFNQATLNNNFADCAERINALRAVVSAAAGGVGLCA